MPHRAVSEQSVMPTMRGTGSTGVNVDRQLLPLVRHAPPAGASAGLGHHRPRRTRDCNGLPCGLRSIFAVHQVTPLAGSPQVEFCVAGTRPTARPRRFAGRATGCARRCPFAHGQRLLKTGGRTGAGQAPVQVLGETLPQCGGIATANSRQVEDHDRRPIRRSSFSPAPINATITPSSVSRTARSVAQRAAITSSVSMSTRGIGFRRSLLNSPSPSEQDVYAVKHVCLLLMHQTRASRYVAATPAPPHRSLTVALLVKQSVAYPHLCETRPPDSRRLPE